jgi:hypothetical protein
LDAVGGLAFGIAMTYGTRMLSFYLAHTLDRAEAKESAINGAMETITYPGSDSLQAIDDETAEAETFPKKTKWVEILIDGEGLDGCNSGAARKASEDTRHEAAGADDNVSDAGEKSDGADGSLAHEENPWIGRASHTASDLLAWRNHERLNQNDVARLFGVRPRVFST